MVAGYHGNEGKQVLRGPLLGSQAVTQGGPLSPWIFNIVADAIVHNWVGLVAENEADPDSFLYTVA